MFVGGATLFEGLMNLTLNDVLLPKTGFFSYCDSDFGLFRPAVLSYKDESLFEMRFNMEAYILLYCSR